MNGYHPDYDYDHTRLPYQQPQAGPSYASPTRQTARRPWSPAEYDSNVGDDGGAIARYLAGHPHQDRGYTVEPAGDEEIARERGHDVQRRYPRSYGHGNFKGGDERYGHSDRRAQRQEASDISVEALDLADYSQTLSRRLQPQAPQPSPPQLRALFPPIAAENEGYSRYPTASKRYAPLDLNDAPLVDRPFSAQSLQSRRSSRTIGPPPSLASAREGLTTPSSKSPRSHPQLQYVGGFPSSPRNSGNKRHLSLPPSLPSGAVIGTLPAPDVRSFPKWSRGWYDSGATSKERGTGPEDPFTVTGMPMLPSQNNRQDPGMSHPQEADLGIWPPQAAANYSPRGSYPLPIDPTSSSPLPWGHSTAHLDAPPEYVSGSVKEERMRMLEREFGPGGRKGKSRMLDGDAEMIGSVDASGSLITDGPRRRAAVRWFQTLLACAVAVSGIYGALVIHPAIPAPPANKLPAYVLYVFSVITVFFTLWFFHGRPCMRRRRRRTRDKFTQSMNPGGMMVLPIVQGLGMGGKKGKKGQPIPMMGGRPGKKPKKGKGGQPQPGDGVQVNLIVDPTMFGGGSRRGRRGSESNSDSEECSDDEERGKASARRGAGKGRRSVVDGLALEEDWKKARKTLKWQMTVDTLLMVMWAAVFFYVLWGKRCPIGGYAGWCTAYNTASAFSFLTSLAFGVGIYYDIRDLSLSKQSPRTRT